MQVNTTPGREARSESIREQVRSRLITLSESGSTFAGAISPDSLRRSLGAAVRPVCIALPCVTVALVAGLFWRDASTAFGCTLIMFLGAVSVSAACGGMAAGLAALLLSVLLSLGLALPVQLPTDPAAGALALSVFLLVAITQLLIGHSQRSELRRAEEVREEGESAVRRSRYLTEVTSALTASLDYNLTLESVANLAVPQIADWCFIDLRDDSGEVRRIACASGRPDRTAQSGGLGKCFADPEDRRGLGHVLRTCRPEYAARLVEPVATEAPEPRFLTHLRELGCASYICVPLVVSGETIGAVTFACAESGRAYTPGDLIMARELAPRVALAIDNARLYGTARRHGERIEAYTQELEVQKLELEAVNLRLEALATTDGLTGLYNHRSFQEQLQRDVLRARRYHQPLCALLLDIDNFKQYNDSFGHPAGDDILKAVAGELRHQARESDFVARYGGEEFVLLLPHTTLADAAIVAERIRAAISSKNWPLRPVTASLGVAALTAMMTDGQELLTEADDALYAAKRAGRDRVTTGGSPAAESAVRHFEHPQSCDLVPDEGSGFCPQR